MEKIKIVKIVVEDINDIYNDILNLNKEIKKETSKLMLQDIIYISLDKYNEFDLFDNKVFSELFDILSIMFDIKIEYSKIVNKFVEVNGIIENYKKKKDPKRIEKPLIII